MTATTCPHGGDAAAYVLGALTEREATEFAAHLRGCDACGEDVSSLQVAADALPAAATPMEPPPELRDRIMAVVNAESELLRASGPEADRAKRALGRGAAGAERRWWRSWWPGWGPVPTAAVAGVLLLLGLGGGLLLGRGDDGGRTRTIAVQGSGGAGGTRASLVLDGGRGRLVVARMPQPPNGRIYQVWRKRPGRSPEPTDALFSPNARGQASVSVPGDVAGVEAVMVTDEPPGGSASPTGHLALQARLT